MPQSYKLFYLLGCLPDGIRREHLKKLWPQESDIENGLKSFNELDFLSSSEEKVSLTAHLIEFVKDTMNPTSRKDFMSSICEFYLEFLKELYQANSAVKEQTYKNKIYNEVVELEVKKAFR